MPKQKQIIYSKRVCEELMQRGFRPIASFPNLFNPKFTCWAFKISDELRQALDEILGGTGGDDNAVQ